MNLRKAFQNNKVAFVGQALLITLSAVCLLASLHPEARTGIRNSVLKDYRTIVSSAKADIAGDGSSFTVVKVKTRDGIVVEVYKQDGSDQMHLQEKIAIGDARDGFFSFNGQATNLALEDIDGDGRREILAPTFDRDLVGRLNIFKFNSQSNAFERAIR